MVEAVTVAGTGGAEDAQVMQGTDWVAGRPSKDTISASLAPSIVKGCVVWTFGDISAIGRF